MKSQFFTLCLLSALLPSFVFAQKAKLDGIVTDENGKPVPSVTVIAPGGQKNQTTTNGHFHIDFDDSWQAGQAITIRIDRTSQVILDPLMARCTTQNVQRNFEPLSVIIVPKGSPLTYSPKQLTRLIGEWAKERALSRNESAENKKTLAKVEAENRPLKAQNVAMRAEKTASDNEEENYDYLKKYAEHVGLPFDELLKFIRIWADKKDAADNEERAAKEYFNGNYQESARLASAAKKSYREMLVEANKEKYKQSRNYLNSSYFEGASFEKLYQFKEALGVFQDIDADFENRILDKLDFKTEWAANKLLMANMEQELGKRVEGTESKKYLVDAVRNCQFAFEVYTQKDLPQQWAGTQNNLGVALYSQGARSSGSEGVRLLSEAVAAYREALRVYTQKDLPQQWAATQNNLGNALRSQGVQTGGEEGGRLVQQAIEAFTLALTVRQKEHDPQGWGQIQNNLAGAYYLLAETHFTTARYAEAETRINALLANAKVEASTKAALRAILVANAVAQGQAYHPEMEALIAAIAAQPPDFRVGWSFKGTSHFIETNEKFIKHREWLKQMFIALGQENRDAILKGLHAIGK